MSGWKHINNLNYPGYCPYCGQSQVVKTNLLKEENGIMTLQEYKDNPYMWPGGYTLIAIMADNGIICSECICEKESPVHDGSGRDEQWHFVGAFIHWEGDFMYCEHCGKELESEYGQLDDMTMMDMEE